MTASPPDLTSTTPPAGARRGASGGLAAIALVVVTAVWGSSFFLTHDLVVQVPPADFAAVRFAIAAVAMLAVFGRSVRAAPRHVVLPGLGIGVVYGLAQILQTYGLAHTSASVSGFLTGLCVVITPLLGALLWRERPAPVTWAAVALSVSGLAVLCLHAGGGLGLGELLTLASAFTYAVQILLLGRYSTVEHAGAMSAIQMVGVAITCAVLGLADGQVVLPQTPGAWTSLIWMALAAGALAMWAQTWAQARMSATRAAIIFTLEPVFASTFAVWFGGESFTLRLLLGGGLIIAAMVLAEVVGARAADRAHAPDVNTP